MRAWLSGENKREEENREPSKGPGRIPVIPSAPGKGPASPLQQPPHTVLCSGRPQPFRIWDQGQAGLSPLAAGQPPCWQWQGNAVPVP